MRPSPKHRHFRSPDKAIIDPAELVISEEKLLQLSQLESIPAESKQLAAGEQDCSYRGEALNVPTAFKVYGAVITWKN